jgi:uncharacterized protein (TIGR03067 family)
MVTFPCLIIFVFVCSSNQPEKGPMEAQQLQGTWRLSGGEEVGRQFTAEEVMKEVEVFTFKGGIVTIHRHGKLIGECMFKVKPGKDFGEIDFKHESGQHQGKTCHAIYSLKGDVLKICTASKMRADKPEERPNVFSTKKPDKPSERAGKLLFILKREKG